MPIRGDQLLDRIFEVLLHFLFHFFLGLGVGRKKATVRACSRMIVVVPSPFTRKVYVLAMLPPMALRSP
jgi:hypothetical protein